MPGAPRPPARARPRRAPSRRARTARGRSRRARFSHASSVLRALRRPEPLDDRLHSLLPSRRAAGPHPELTERQIDVVEHDADLVGTDAILFAKSSNGLSGGVHVRLRKGEQHAPARDRSASHPGLALARPDPDALFRRQLLDRLEPRVVAGVLVAFARVAEAD